MTHYNSYQTIPYTDAIYAATFANTLHLQKTPNWITVRFYDRLLLDLVPIIAGYVCLYVNVRMLVYS